MTKRKTKEQGMTLLEVMVALVIFSTAALALMNSVTLNVRFTHSLSETLQAGWVAENQLAQAQLAQTDFPDAEQVGTETMGGQTWTWHIQRVKTAENTAFGCAQKSASKRCATGGGASARRTGGGS